ncbi:hypothetical protein V1498_05215 [Peribacillus sp. SCS-26]|uniref:hypothetical protein n=1 Tax=Paraperibacillus marinus TaxID=3115295 RepID=UPI003906871E
MGILTRFNKVCETSDKNRLPELRTHYYKAPATKAFAAVEELFSTMKGCRLINVSKEHGEISAELSSPQSFVVATIVGVHGNETAVDFILSTEKTSLTGSFPALKRQAVSLYSALDSRLQLISSGRG